jgi:hypothetical protein
MGARGFRWRARTGEVSGEAGVAIRRSFLFIIWRLRFAFDGFLQEDGT